MNKIMMILFSFCIISLFIGCVGASMQTIDCWYDSNQPGCLEWNTDGPDGPSVDPAPAPAPSPEPDPEPEGCEGNVD